MSILPVLQDVLGFDPLRRGRGGEAGSPRPVLLTANGVVGDWPVGVEGLPELLQPLGYEAGLWLVLGSIDPRLASGWAGFSGGAPPCPSPPGLGLRKLTPETNLTCPSLE